MTNNQRFATTLIVIFLVVIPLLCGLTALAFYAISQANAESAVYNDPIVEDPVAKDPEVPAVTEKDPDPVSVSCVVRMEPGESANVFTETWDSETRVWIHKNGGTCEGPYCFSYDSCADPMVTLTRQPFWTGHERNPVDGGLFQICYDFDGDCSR